MESTNTEVMQGEMPPMRLREAGVKYIACLAAFILALVVEGFIPGSLVGFVVYFGCGFFLNKTVLPRLVEFHPVWATVDNISSLKLWSFLLWPIRYFFLLMKLGITKVL